MKSYINEIRSKFIDGKEKCTACVTSFSVASSTGMEINIFTWNNVIVLVYVLLFNKISFMLNFIKNQFKYV